MQFNCHFCTSKTKYILMQTALGIFLVLLLGLVFGLLVMLLWNAILPDLLSFPIIGYWQSVGLVIMLRLLFGSPHPYHKKHGEPAACQKHFMTTPSDDSELENKLYEDWWQEEGAASLRAYQDKGKKIQ
jgi:hypothetical protein